MKDFERPLNARGKKDAPRMAEHIVSNIPKIDLLISSEAKRARLTARHFIAAWGLIEDQVFYTRDMYLASPIEIQTIVRSVDEKVAKLALVGHNPGLTECVNLVPLVSLDNLPTCGIYTGQYDGPWKSFEFDVSKHQSVVYPKMLFND